MLAHSRAIIAYGAGRPRSKVCVCVCVWFEDGLEFWSSSIVAAFGSQGCVVKTRPWLLQPVPADLRPAGRHTEHKTCLAKLSEIVLSF